MNTRSRISSAKTAQKSDGPSQALLAPARSWLQPRTEAVSPSFPDRPRAGFSLGSIALLSTPIQAKLKIGPPGDKYEQEADRVAEQVMRMPEPKVEALESVVEGGRLGTVQRACSKCEEEVRRQPVDENEDEEDMLRTKPLSGKISPLIQLLTSGRRICK